MKAAIVTLYGEFNYGNRLQNYAVQKCLEKLGFQAETIVAKKPVSSINRVKRIIKNIILTMPVVDSNRRLDLLREKEFIYFTKTYITTRYIVSTDGSIPHYISDEYDKFIIGSDQVWNPCFGGYEKQYQDMFLFFTESEKKVCFSPSIGVSRIPDGWLERFIDGFKSFPLISVREKIAADIVESCTGQRPDVLVDPAFMLTAQEWLKVAKTVVGTNTPYILEYFLGELSPEENEKINTFAASRGLKRIRLLDKSNPNIFRSGPGQFISLVAGASMVHTDSYHACVFSIQFGKPFIIRRRQDANEDMYSRIDSLLELFDIHGDCSLEAPYSVDEQVRDKILDAERRKVFSFIKKSISIGDR
jgi:hypothetical protein